MGWGSLCSQNVEVFRKQPQDEVTKLVCTTRKTAGMCHSCSHGSCHFELHICYFWGKYFLGMGGFRTAVANASEPISDDLFGYLRI